MTKSPFLLTSLALSLSACTGAKNDDNTIIDPSDVDRLLIQFETCNDTKNYIGDVVLNQILSYRYSYYGGLDMGLEDSGAEAEEDEVGILDDVLTVYGQKPLPLYLANLPVL